MSPSRKWLKPNCEECGADQRLEARHADLWPTNNTPENIRTLCNACHRGLHAKLRRLPGRISPKQVRMARAGLGWTAKDLAKRSRLALATIGRAESGDGITAANWLSIQHAFQEAGVAFLEEDQTSPGGGRGVRLPKRPTEDRS